MRPTSLALLREAARINPHVKVSALVNDTKYGEAMVDVILAAAYPGRKAFTINCWHDIMADVARIPLTLGEYMDSPAVRALLRAQEVAHAAA